jgi:hypothetical protein
MIDLDTFDQRTYFPVKTFGHCVPIALALHRITGWPLFVLKPDFEWMRNYQVTDQHAVVLSPLGYLDVYGPHAEEWVWRSLGLDSVTEIEEIPWTARALEDNYLNEHDSFNNAYLDAHPEEAEDPRINLELAIPVAEAILARYFPNGWEDKQLSLF